MQINSYKRIFFWLVLLAFSFLTIVAMGRVGLNIISYGLWLFISLYIIRLLSNNFFLVYITFIFILSSLYLPTAIYYGELDLGAVVSLYETNWDESTEYISVLGFKNYLYLGIYIFLFFSLIYFSKYVEDSTNRKKMLYIFLFIVVIPIIERPIQDIYKSKTISIDKIHRIDYYPFRLIADFSFYSYEYFKNKNFLEQSLSVKPTWKIKKKDLPYRTYVLVIGESMRKDYMSAYGYPIDTTPFLSKVNGVIFNNYITPSYNTRTSLQRMLFQNKGVENIVYSNTIITLANSIDMDTYWLSNQGQYGNYDVLASSIGHRAKHVFFVENKKSNSHKSDLQLLTPFRKAIKNPGNKLIILHLMGSHSGFCNRLDPEYKIDNITNFINTDLSCYLSTLRQTDKLLEILYTDLKKQGDYFSLMYLSDHGLTHKKKNFKGITLLHNFKFKQNYEVPLIVLSSDSINRTYIDSYKSGYNFINGVAEWFGVEEENLKLSEPFFTDTNSKKIQVFNGNEVIDYDSLADDPAMTK